MSNGVLSRDELHAAYRAGGPEGLTHYERLALVEAAVLAKITRRRDELDYPSTTGECREYLDKIRKNYVTEREARLRERAAYRMGHDEGKMGASSFINTHYPLPSCDKCGQKLP